MKSKVVRLVVLLSNCLGWTYTPWAHSRDLLERFADLADSYQPPAKPIKETDR